MRKLKIYLAGAMGGLTYEEYNNWRIYASRTLYRVNKFSGYDVDLDIINPADYYNFDNPRHASEREVMKFDLRHVKSSESQGTTAELAVAYDHDIPIIGVNANNLSLHPWDKAFCDRIFDDWDEALDYVENFYLRRVKEKL